MQNKFAILSIFVGIIWTTIEIKKNSLPSRAYTYTAVSCLRTDLQHAFGNQKWVKYTVHSKG